MPLPKIATPTYELELPSTGEPIQYRPFLVKEEKILVIALESEDTKQITTAIKGVIKNCIKTKGIKVEQVSIDAIGLPSIIESIHFNIFNLRSERSADNGLNQFNLKPGSYIFEMWL